MSNLTTSGSSSYPGSLDSVTTLVDGAAGDQILARHPNGLGAAVIAIETELGVDPAGTLADVTTRLGVAHNTDGTVLSSVMAAGPGAGVSYSAGVFTVSFSGDGPSFLQNCAVRIDPNAPVANQFRINLLQADLSTPTTALPVRVSFRATTVSSGIYNTRLATTTTQLVITGGSTLGFLDNELGRIYIGLIDNQGVPELCAWNSKVLVASTTAARCVQLWRPSEAELYSTTAEGGAGAADSAATLYSATARSSVPIRLLAYLDMQTGSTAGNWSNSPADLQLIGPQTRTTGDIIQRIGTQSSTVKTGTSTVPNDGTIPQISEGDLYLWATMTASNVVNPVAINGILELATSASGIKFVSHVHRNGEANALGAAQSQVAVVNAMHENVFHYVIATTTSGATAYHVLAGGTTAATTTFNGENGASALGSAVVSYLECQEICA